MYISSVDLSTLTVACMRDKLIIFIDGIKVSTSLIYQESCQIKQSHITTTEYETNSHRRRVNILLRHSLIENTTKIYFVVIKSTLLV